MGKKNLREKDLREKDPLLYWCNHTTFLAFQEMVKQRLPLKVRIFNKVNADETWLDRRANCIRVAFYFDKMYNQRFECCFKATDFEAIAGDRPVICADMVKKGKRAISKNSQV